MKPTSILAIIPLAAGMLAACSGRAQTNVYSLNVVGYYNVALTPGWNLLANQFIMTNANANYVLASMPPDGSLLYRFNPLTQGYYDAGTYFTNVGWYPLSGDTNDSVLNLPLGESFLVWTPQPWTNTFVGEVAQGNLVNPLPAYYSLKASMVPQAGLLQTDLVFPAYAGDQVWKWGAAAFTPYTYNNVGGAWVPSEPSLGVGQGFFLYRAPDQATTNHWWVRNFVVQVAPSPPSNPKTAGGSLFIHQPMVIQDLSFSGGNAVLVVMNPPTSPYSVQFSGDRVNWQTVATGQTASVWQERARAGVQGFYRLAANP
jgi:hypothetical protein